MLQILASLVVLPRVGLTHHGISCLPHRLLRTCVGRHRSPRWVFSSSDKLLGKPGLLFTQISPDCAVSK